MKIEDIMAQAAYSQITETMPSLQQYLLGFGIIDADEKENRGIGVLLAKLGDTYIYIPSIYRRGQICDMDLLYEPENNRFLPVQDNTLSYLMSKKTDTTGDIVDKPQVTRGGTNGGAGGVSLNLPFTMFSKVASAGKTPEMLKVASMQMADIIVNTFGSIPAIYTAIDNISAPQISKLASAAMSEALLRKLDTPAGYNAFAQFYDEDDMGKIVDTLAANVAIDRVARETKAAEPVKTPVKVLTAASAEARDLSDEEKSAILRDGAIIVDNRGLVPSEIYKEKQNSDWQTPGRNGLYELLRLDGRTVTAYVINLNGAEGFDTITKTREAYGIIPVDDGDARRIHRIDFAPLGQYYPLDMSVPLGGVDISDISDNTFEHGQVVVVTPGGQALLLKTDYQSGHGHWLTSDEDKFVGIALKAKMLDYAEDLGRLSPTSDTGEDWIDAQIESKLSPMPQLSSNLEKISQIAIGRPTSKMQIRGNTLRVPEGSKVYQVPYESSNNDLDLVDQSNAVDAIAERDKLVKVTIYNADGLVTLSDKMMKKASGTKTDVAKYLVQEYAVAPKQAMKIVKEACAVSGGESYLIKIAESSGFDMAFAQEEPAYVDYSENTVLEPMKSEDINDEELISNAVNSGVKEVLDVDMLKMLTEDDASLREIRGYVPKLLAAVDALGRLLFLTRVNDSVTETYGEQRTLVMEKSIKSTFFKLWDIILGLRQGQVEDVSDLLGGELSQSIG